MPKQSEEPIILSDDEVVAAPPALIRAGLETLPVAIAAAGTRTSERFIEFFTANIRNRNTRMAYAAAVRQFFDWYEDRGHGWNPELEPRGLGTRAEVRGQARQDPRAIGRPGPATLGLDRRDRAQRAARPGFNAVMVYSFARVSAVATLRVEDYFEHGKRAWLRLHEKGCKRHEVPCHHKLAEYLDAWVEAAGIASDKKSPLFRAIRKGNRLTENSMARENVLEMIKRRAAGTALPCTLLVVADPNRKFGDALSTACLVGHIPRR